MAGLPRLTVTSPAYREGQPIPREFTCDGDDRSPPLAVAGFPPQARWWALVLDDPDAPRGTWTHWTFWDLPVADASLPAGADVAALGAVEGLTSAKEVGYHGPCPPGGTHRYVATAYATTDRLGLPRGAPVADVHAALRAKAVASGALLGTYGRS